MYETANVPVADLLLDTGNARLGEEQSTQQAVYLSLAQQQGHRLVILARDIVENGLDPTTLPAVIPTDDTRRRYVVVEGNRRVLALKALDTPSIVTPALKAADQTALSALAAKYAANPLDEIACVLFPNETEARHWVQLRHTGANDGAGLIEWDSNEKDRYRARHGGNGTRTLGGQVLDLLERLDGFSKTARIHTNVSRLMNSPSVREKLGLGKEGKELTSAYPAAELLKGLRHIVGDLSTGEIKVSDIYYETQRRQYIEGFHPKDLPNPSKKFSNPVPLSLLQTTTRGGAHQPTAPSKRPSKPKPTRVSLIPRSCSINPTVPRLNAIYNELLTLNATQYPNAASVLLRVFVELSIDHYLTQMNLSGENEKLAKKLKVAADDLKKKGQIDDQLRKAIDRIANSQTVIAASTFTFNQYVHNRYSHPIPSELFIAWDELEPFLLQVCT